MLDSKHLGTILRNVVTQTQGIYRYAGNCTYRNDVYFTMPSKSGGDYGIVFNFSNRNRLHSFEARLTIEPPVGGSYSLTETGGIDFVMKRLEEAVAYYVSTFQ